MATAGVADLDSVRKLLVRPGGWPARAREIFKVASITPIDFDNSSLPTVQLSLPASRPRNRRSPEAAHWRPRSSPADARPAASRSDSAGAAVPTRERRNSLRLAVDRPCDAASHTSRAG